jgi:periplasmic protein CpxP/Spy
MNKNVKALIWAVVALVFINLGALAFLLFQKPVHPGPPMERGPKNIIIKRLQFDDAQVEEYEYTIHKHRTEISTVEFKIRAIKDQLYKSLSVQHLEDEEKEELIAEIGKLQQEIERIHYSHFLEIKEICKEGQMDLFEELAKDLSRYFSHHGPSGKKH